MRIRLIATLLAVPTTAVLLAGCSSIEGNTDRPGPSRTGHTLKSSLTEEEAAAQKERDMELCVDAVTERAATDADGDVEADPRPDTCTWLTESEYLDAYLDGIRQADQAG